jgi:Peptidase family M23
LRKTQFFCATFIVPVCLFSAALSANAFFDYKSPFRVGVIDWLRSSPEGGTMDSGTKFLSGSVLRKGGVDVNVPVPCSTKKCQHIEFVNIPGVPDFVDDLTSAAATVTKKENPLSVLGNRWEVGPDHLVPGGFGVLAVGPLALEPTGRLVVQGVDGPAAIKIVLISVNEKKGTALFQGYGRACIKAPFKGWISCSAFVNPLPMFIMTTQGVPMPVDIKISGKMPNPLPLSPKALVSQSNFSNKLQQSLLAQGISTAGGFIGSGGASSAQQQPGPIAAPSGGYSAPVTLSGAKIRPIAGSYVVTSGYGNRVHPISGNIKFHDGIDFGVPSGTPVLAVASGRIMYQGTLGGYGNVVVIDHGGGYSSLYGHLSGYLTSGAVGTVIQAGTPIATVGSSGTSTGPHLHLNINAGGDGVDPRSGHPIDPSTFIPGL